MSDAIEKLVQELTEKCLDEIVETTFVAAPIRSALRSLAQKVREQTLEEIIKKAREHGKHYAANEVIDIAAELRRMKGQAND